MARNIYDLEMPVLPEATRPPWAEVADAMSIVCSYCKRSGIDMIIDPYDFYTDYDKLFTESNMGEEFENAIDCITDYCWDNDAIEYISTILIANITVVFISIGIYYS